MRFLHRPIVWQGLCSVVGPPLACLPCNPVSALTVAYNNLTNVFGISEDRAQVATGCSKSNLVNPGSVESKLGKYFNTSCLTTPPIIGADGIGTAFGNSASGIVDGPGQFNIDLEPYAEHPNILAQGRLQPSVPGGLLQRAE